MKIIGYLIYGIGILITIGWIVGIRDLTRKGGDLNKGTVITTALYALSLVLVPAFHLTPFHLLWLFPLSLVIGSGTVIWLSRGSFLAGVLSDVLWSPARIFYHVVCVGIDREESLRNYNSNRMRNWTDIYMKGGLSREEATEKAAEEIRRTDA